MKVHLLELSGPPSAAVAPTEQMMAREAPPAPKPLVQTQEEADEHGRRFWSAYQSQATPHDRDLYFSPEKLYAQLAEGPDGRPAPVRLMRGSWLLARARRLRKCKTDEERARWALPRRQELPEVAFLSEAEVRKLRRGHAGEAFDTCCLSDENRGDRPLLIISISQCARSPARPPGSRGALLDDGPPWLWPSCLH